VSFPVRCGGGRLNTRVAFQIVRETRPLPALRFWFEAGTQDDPNDRDKNGVIDSVQDTMDMADLLAQKGYKTGTDLIYRQVDGGRHELGTWILVLPEFLAWAFPPIP
jgi:enterochelin esterase family protein